MTLGGAALRHRRAVGNQELGFGHGLFEAPVRRPGQCWVGGSWICNCGIQGEFWAGNSQVYMNPF